MQKLNTPRTNLKVAGATLAVAAAGTQNTDAVNTGGYSGFVAYLNVTAHSGTTPTLDIKFQDSADNGTTWFDIASGAFTQVTTTDGKQRLVVNNVGPKIRAVVVAGGTTPTYTLTLDVCGIN